MNDSAALNAVNAALEHAQRLFPKLRIVPDISFTQSGKAAGKCTCTFNWRGAVSQCHLNFNPTAIKLNPSEFINDTIPHEIAHLVVAVLHGRKVKPHGVEWQTVCRVLGGSGRRTHTLTLESGRKQRQWLYRDSAGQLHRLSTIRHRRLQKGLVYRIPTDNAVISAGGFVTEIAAKNICDGKT